MSTRTEHLADHLSQHGGHVITVTLLALALGLVTDSEVDANFPADRAELLLLANHRANHRAQFLSCQGYTLTADEKVLWNAHYALYA